MSGTPALTILEAARGEVITAQSPDQSRIRANYGPNDDRLAAIEQTYDPDNLFHRNQTIAPAG